MYRSHPVRRMCDDPMPGETASLVVEPDEDSDVDRSAIAAAVADVGGSVADELRFGSFLVTLPEEGVEALCSMDGLARVETANTLGLGIGEE
ncbi:hypothetical protein [Halopelagius fulvigenes]|uniref:Putative peptidase inhibitor domain-containing protein n=1 Tax=Halopelagius fulvigenes TaxID=1198324 RepID=A0ABD5TUX9_9EURY